MARDGARAPAPPSRGRRRRERSGAGRLLVVSNRLPVTGHRGRRGLEWIRSTGGLVSALEPVLREHGGVWIGWPGLDLGPGERLPRNAAPYAIRAVRPTDLEMRGHYHGFSNRTLWPLFHCFTDRTRYDGRDWNAYVHVNARFADAAAEAAADGGLVWFHDYQLMLAPGRLRATAPACRTAFFLHIPFPPADVFRLLPWDRELLRGVLGADLVGFHVASYARNFLDCVESLLGLDVDRERMLVDVDGRTVRVGAFPLGVDFEGHDARARAAPAVRVAHTGQMILGVDRLDYTKGIPERIRAVERLLERHPERRGRVVLLELAVPSRSQVAEYRDLKREIDELVGHVNGRFATETWSPVRYLYRSVPPEQLAALYRDADVALVTPLRDGMNLVAKEFVASQVARPGVLVLSRLAGAAETMREAVLVNPCDVEGTAAALEQALSMPEPERRRRLAALRARERDHDVRRWAADFLAAAREGGGPARGPTATEIAGWLDTALAGRRVALFLDYDGTLTPLCAHPAQARLSAEMGWAISACADRPDTDVTIVSGRALGDVAGMVNHAGITYAGNHGLEISGPGLVPFRHRDLPHFQSAVEALAAALGEVACDGAWVEAKGPTLTFHFRAVPPDRQAKLAARARAIIGEAGFQARDAHAAVEARPPIGWDKGQAVLHVLRERYGPGWARRARAVYVGDDNTDEDVFRALAGIGVTFRVGPPGTPTGATHRLDDVAGVRALLEWIAARAAAGSPD